MVLHVIILQKIFQILKLASWLSDSKIEPNRESKHKQASILNLVRETHIKQQGVVLRGFSDAKEVQTK